MDSVVIRCFNCGEDKPPSMFHKDTKCPNRHFRSSRCIACAKAQRKEWWKKNKAVASKKHKEWIVQNVEKVRAQQKLYDAKRATAKKAYNASRREQNNAAARRRYATGNLDKIKQYTAAYYAKNSDSIKAKCAAYRKNNKGYFVARNAKRKADKLTATPSWADESVIRAIYEEAAELGLSVDHIVPLRSKLVCGLHNEFNLQPIPLGDNIAKSNRHWPDMP